MTRRATNRDSGSNINRHCGNQTESRADRQADRATGQTDQTDGHADRRTCRQTNTQADIQAKKLGKNNLKKECERERV